MSGPEWVSRDSLYLKSRVGLPLQRAEVGNGDRNRETINKIQMLLNPLHLAQDLGLPQARLVHILSYEVRASYVVSSNKGFQLRACPLHPLLDALQRSSQETVSELLFL